MLLLSLSLLLDCIYGNKIMLKYEEPKGWKGTDSQLIREQLQKKLKNTLQYFNTI